MKSSIQTVEVEVTAKLNKKQYSSLEKYLSKNFKKVSFQKRYMVKFHRKEKINLNDRVDLRYKWTNGAHQIVVKQGAVGSKSRKEITIDLAGNQIEHFSELFSLLGYKLANNMYREMERFVGEGVEVTLVKAPGGYSFVEIEALSPDSTPRGVDQINEFCRKAKLKPMDKDQYQTFVTELDDKINLQVPIKDFPHSLLSKKDWKKILEETVFSS